MLEKDSSVLGYPGEISKALNADHHGVCKFEGPQDPNYVTVRNVLKSIMSKIIARDNAKDPGLSERRASVELKSLLSLPELPGLDYIFFHDQWTENTHRWISDDKKFLQWRDYPGGVSILWINGGAGTGKSILASTIINDLSQQERQCQFFFIRYAHRQKRTLSLLLRSLAFQVAECLPDLVPKINEVGAEGIDFETADPRIIWDRLFKSLILRTNLKEPLYWIVDGVDEAESPRDTIRTLLDISSAVPVRILFTSRRYTEIEASLERRPLEVNFEAIEMETHMEDIRVHVRQELRVPGGEDVRARVEKQIIEHSHNSFLVSCRFFDPSNIYETDFISIKWARLAVDRVNRCYTLQDIDTALLELPEGMDALYDRMARSVESIPNPRDKQLAKQILQCLTCSARLLTVPELSQALGEAARGILDLPQTVRDLCGDFVVADNDGKFSLIHHTAREYLLSPSHTRPLTINLREAHKVLFLSSVRHLMSTNLRAKLARNQTPEFLDYAASYWSTHLIHTPSTDEDITKSLIKFLTGKWVLTWIEFLAQNEQLKVLIQASKHLSKFVTAYKAASSYGSSLDCELFSSWSTDMVRILGKFGNVLRRKPDAIYATIPVFCPKSSSIYRQFGRSDSLEIHGTSLEFWDDCFAHVSLGKSLASAVVATGSQAAVLTAPGTVRLFEASDFREAPHSPMSHGERVHKIAMNKSATLLVAYGYFTTSIWKISSGQCILSVNSVESKTRPLSMLFIDGDSTLLVGTDDRVIRSISLAHPDPDWTVVAEFEEEEMDGYFVNSASHMALSPDGTMAAVGYRGYPTSAWEIEAGAEAIHIGHCRREDSVAVVRELRELVWHPYQPEVLGLNFEGTVFRWAPYEDDVSELPGTSTKLAISYDGELFATGDSHGRVAVYETASFALLYQISSQDAVFGLAFSPDSKRFYDIRNYHLNAWEPSVLTKYCDKAGRDSDSGSSSDSLRTSELSNVTSTAVDPITSVVGCPSGKFYCCGSQTGTLSLYSSDQGKLANLYSSMAKFAIEHVAWSDDSRHICALDFSKRLVIFEFFNSAGTVPTYKQVASVALRNSVKGRVVHLSFYGSPPSAIFLQTTSQTHAISLSNGSVKGSANLTAFARSWIAHPSTPGLFLGFTSTEIVAVDMDMVEQARWKLDWPDNLHIKEMFIADDNEAGQVFMTLDKKHILLSVSLHDDQSRRTQLLFLETAQMTLAAPAETPFTSGTSTVHLKPLSTEGCVDIVRVLGLLRGDRLAFISSGYAVCSFQLKWIPQQIVAEKEEREKRIEHNRSTTFQTARRAVADGSGAKAATKDPNKRLKELFALPGDWTSEDAVKSCILWQGQRSLLYPRNGQVAVVKCTGLA